MNVDRAATLEDLAAAIRRAGLEAPAGFLLDAFAPLDVVASQIALFGRPLFGGTRYDVYATVLAEAGSWKELRRLLARQ